MEKFSSRGTAVKSKETNKKKRGTTVPVENSIRWSLWVGKTKFHQIRRKSLKIFQAMGLSAFHTQISLKVIPVLTNQSYLTVQPD